MVKTIRQVSLGHLIIGALLGGLCASLHAHEKALEAQRAYKQGAWDKALALYTAAEPKTSAVWYNMGNVHYQKDDYSNAITCWKRACAGASYRDLTDINHNISCACKKMGLDRAHSYSWYAWIQALMPPLGVLQIIFLLAWYAIVMLFIVRRRFSRFLLMIGFSLSILVAVLLGTILVVEYRNCSTKMGVVVSKVVNVYAGPDKKYHILGIIHEMDDIVVEEHRSGWYKINARTVRGWVPANALCIL